MSDDVELNVDGSAEFDAGFSGAPTETPEKIEADAGQPTPSQEQQPEPKFRQITEEEYTKLASSAAAVDELRATLGKQVDTAFGKIGGLERVLKQFQEQTPAGQAVEITEEDLAELRDEFPEMVAPQLKALQRIAGKMRGTGNQVELDEGRIHQVVSPLLDKVTPDIAERIKGELSVQNAKETLAETHPDWEVVIGNAYEDKPASKEFLEWLGTQPQEYRERLNSSVNPVVIGRAIDKFREHQESLRKNAERRDRFEEAVTPRGDGGHEPPPDDNDAFNAGFAGR